MAIGIVVDSGRYRPTANDNDLTPQSSIHHRDRHAGEDQAQGRSCASRPRMIVAIRLACGAG